MWFLLLIKNISNEMTSITDKLGSVWTFASEMPSDDITSFVLLVVAGLALHEWAIIHYWAGYLTLGETWANDQGIGGFFAVICESTGIDYKAYTYPKHTNRVFIQHGLNLAFAGLFADFAIGALMFNSSAAPFFVLVPWLFDVGYFVAMDLPHFGSVMAQTQTYIISTALICSAFFTYLNSGRGDWDLFYMVPFVALGVGLISAAILNSIVKFTVGGWEGTPLLMDGSTDFTGEPML